MIHEEDVIVCNTYDAFCFCWHKFFAQEWVKIAEKTVNFKAEKDVVIPQGNERKVDKIRIKCIQGTLKLKKVTVEMSDV